MTVGFCGSYSFSLAIILFRARSTFDKKETLSESDTIKRLQNEKADQNVENL